MSNVSTKVQKDYPDFAAEVQGLDADAIKARIVQLQSALEESEAFREADESLARAKEEVKQLSAPYNEVRKAVRQKTSYLVQLLNDKGG